MNGSILIIEDEDLLGEELRLHFQKGGWRTTRVATYAEARGILIEEGRSPDVVLSDLSLPDGVALDLLQEIRERGAAGEWIFLTGYGTVPDSVRALRLGAHDFLEKPFPMDRLDVVVGAAMRSARAQSRLRDETDRKNRRYSPEAFLGSSESSRHIRAMMRRLAEVPLTSLVLGGETGTGKGLAARIIHYTGVRSSGPLVEVNCAALPRDLLESELFGHEAGAFTGARGRHRGLFEQAYGGTLFLDEVSELPTGLQAKLLKAVEDHRIRRVGGEKEIEVDVQLFAASNRDLLGTVKAGEFRQDLYHRLSVFSLELPPLRRRLGDLEDLVPAFVAEFSALSGKRVREIPAAVWDKFRAYSWPGNIRELRNVLERSVLLSNTNALSLKWLQLPREGKPVSGPALAGEEEAVDFPLDGTLSLDEMEAHIIREALKRSRLNVTAAARLLGVTRQTLRYRIEKHGIDMEP
jgi:DNA-binding NtrC family response regulator